VETRNNAPHRALVLVVDDEEAMLEVFTETLERIGVDVVPQSDPRRAAESIQRGEAYDVAVLDLRLPHVDGLALLELIRKHQPALPVVVVTGYPNPQTAQRCRELGAWCYLRKPFEPDELARQVRRALARRSPSVPRT
jgi:CheY-like chemotaxis protein